MHELNLEMLENNMVQLNETLQKNNVSIEENTPDQIMNLAIEMYQRLTNTFVPSFEIDQLKNKLRSYWKPTARCHGYVCHISSKFVDEKKLLFI